MHRYRERAQSSDPAPATQTMLSEGSGFLPSEPLLFTPRHDAGKHLKFLKFRNKRFEQRIGVAEALAGLRGWIFEASTKPLEKWRGTSKPAGPSGLSFWESGTNKPLEARAKPEAFGGVLEEAPRRPLLDRKRR